MRHASLGAACLVFACVAGAAGLTYAQAQAQSDRDEASLSSAETEALLTAQGELIGNAVTACVDMRNPPDKIQVGVIMELNAQGQVVRTWRRDDDALSACFARKSEGVLLLLPPRTPFYTGIDLSLDLKREG
jgi:hypothetical protein